MRISRSVAIAAAVVAVWLVVAAAPAAAHTQKNVGAYQFTVGWGSEPAYAGQLNSVQLVLKDISTGKPYTKLADTLKVTVIYGQQTVEYALTPTFDPDTGFGTPGDYRAHGCHGARPGGTDSATRGRFKARLISWHVRIDRIALLLCFCSLLANALVAGQDL